MTQFYFVGIDVWKDATSVCLRDDYGDIVTSFEKPIQLDIAARALGAGMEYIGCVAREKSGIANWLYEELRQSGLPMVCTDARQAHAVLSRMHNKTEENDSVMMLELARAFYKEIEVKSCLAQDRRALCAPARASTRWASARKARYADYNLVWNQIDQTSASLGARGEKTLCRN